MCLEAAGADVSSSARAHFKREPARIRAWRRVGLGRVRQVYGWNTEETSAMPLNERVGEIFIEAAARAAFSESLARFLVEDAGIFEPGTDTVRDELRVVLLVASPHTDEVRDGYPLAGSSGTRVRNALDRCYTEGPLPNEPIGSLIYDNHPNFFRLGIMNVSWLPFEREAYEPCCVPCRENDCRNHPEWPNYRIHMNTIFQHPERGRRNRRNCKYLDDAIAADLRGRLEYLHESNPDVLLARCGEVAQKFYEKAGIDMPYCDLPHPANRGRGGDLWHNLDCGNACLQNIIECIGLP